MECTGRTRLKPDAVPTIFDFPGHLLIKKPKPRKKKLLEGECSSTAANKDLCAFPVIRPEKKLKVVPKSLKKFRYIGDFDEEDMESPGKALKLLMITKMNYKSSMKKIKKLQKRNKFLERKIATLEEIINKMNNKASIPDSVGYTLKVVDESQPGPSDADFEMRILETSTFHTSTKSYVCPLCSKSFTLSSSLIRHRKKHNEDKTFTCELCQRTFKQKDNLKKHLRSHFSENELKGSCIDSKDQSPQEVQDSIDSDRTIRIKDEPPDDYPDTFTSHDTTSEEFILPLVDGSLTKTNSLAEPLFPLNARVPSLSAEQDNVPVERTITIKEEPSERCKILPTSIGSINEELILPLVDSSLTNISSLEEPQFPLNARVPSLSAEQDNVPVEPTITIKEEPSESCKILLTSVGTINEEFILPLVDNSRPVVEKQFIVHSRAPRLLGEQANILIEPTISKEKLAEDFPSPSISSGTINEELILPVVDSFRTNISPMVEPRFALSTAILNSTNLPVSSKEEPLKKKARTDAS